LLSQSKPQQKTYYEHSRQSSAFCTDAADPLPVQVIKPEKRLMKEVNNYYMPEQRPAKNCRSYVRTNP